MVTYALRVAEHGGVVKTSLNASKQRESISCTAKERVYGSGPGTVRVALS